MTIREAPSHQSPVPRPSSFPLHHLPDAFAASLRRFFVDDDEMAGVSDDFFALHVSGLDRRSAFVVEAAGEVTAGAVSCLLYTSPSPRD